MSARQTTHVPGLRPSRTRPGRGPNRSRTRNSQPAESGFTVIELMIVVAIIGILTTLALSFERGAVMRAHIADGIYTVAPLKTMIHESLALDEAANACVGIRDITSPVGALASAVCTDDGTVANVRVVMDERAGNVVMDFVNDRTASAMWVCVGDMTTEGARYMPAGCRN